MFNNCCSVPVGAAIPLLELRWRVKTPRRSSTTKSKPQDPCTERVQSNHLPDHPRGSNHRLQRAPKRWGIWLGTPQESRYMLGFAGFVSTTLWRPLSCCVWCCYRIFFDKSHMICVGCDIQMIIHIDKQNHIYKWYANLQMYVQPSTYFAYIH